MGYARLRGPQLPRRLPGNAHRRRTPTVVRVPQRHNFTGPGVTTGHQHRCLIGFSTAIAEERFRKRPARRQTRQLFRQRHLRLIGKDRGNMLQLVDLRVYFGVYLIIAVPYADCDNAPEKVQVLIAVRIPDKLIFRVRDHQRLRKVVEHGRKEELFLGQEDFLFRHSSILSLLCEQFATQCSDSLAAQDDPVADHPHSYYPATG